jgi:hypothetical protein
MLALLFLTKNLGGGWIRQIVSVHNGFAEFYDEQGNFIQNAPYFNLINNPSICPNSFGFFDPRVMYDPVHDRFILTILYADEQTFHTNSKILVCISNNGNPNNGFEIFDIECEAGHWYDYPNIGMSSNDLFFTVNKLNSSGAMVGTDIYQIPKIDIYNHTSWSTVIGIYFFDVVDFSGQLARSICVATAGAPQMTSYGPGVYLVSTNTSIAPPWQTTQTLYDITDDYYPSMNPSLTKTSYIHPDAFQKPSTAFQPVSKNRLGCGGANIQSAYYLDGIIHFVLNGKVFAPNTMSAIFYVRFDVINNIPLYVEITPNIVAPNQEWFAYPSICHMGSDFKDKSSAIVYLASSEAYYPEVRTILFDDLMSPSPQVTFNYGTGYLSQLGTDPTIVDEIRWGDYTGIQRIYDDACPRNWLTGEFGNSLNMHMLFFAETQCGPLTTQNPIPYSGHKVYPIPCDNTLSIEIYSTNEAIHQITISALDGKAIQKEQVTLLPGLNKLNYSMNNVQSGIYLLSIINLRNHETIIQKVIKN